MKKLFYLLFALPMLFLASCSDDNKLPDVDLNVTFANCAMDEETNTIYVVQGETFSVESVKLVVNEDKKGALGVVNYYLDGYRIAASVTEPYSVEISTEGLSTGEYVFSVESGIYVVDYPMCVGAVGFNVKVVSSVDEIPSTAVTSPSVSGQTRVTSGK